MDNKIEGIAKKTSIIRMITLSNQPPKYPARAPKKPPIIIDAETAIKPIVREILVP